MPPVVLGEVLFERVTRLGKKKMQLQSSAAAAAMAADLSRSAHMGIQMSHGGGFNSGG